MRNIYLIYIFSATIVIGVLIVSFVVFRDVPQKIAIHFTAEQGIDIFGDRTDIYAIAIAGLLLNIINFGLTRIIYSRNQLLGWVITGTSTFISFGIVLAITTIIINN